MVDLGERPGGGERGGGGEGEGKAEPPSVMFSPTPTIMYPASKGPSALRSVGLCSQCNETSNDRVANAASILCFRQTLISNAPPLPHIHSIITNIISPRFPSLDST